MWGTHVVERFSGFFQAQVKAKGRQDGPLGSPAFSLSLRSIFRAQPSCWVRHGASVDPGRSVGTSCTQVKQVK
jgi:hypothetical protein